jgi:dihydrofolate reductase
LYSIIAAVGENNELGLNGGLPWHLPSELRYFRQVTEHHTLIMGRKTYESLPRVLPNRKHIVLTRNVDYLADHPDVIVAHGLDEVLALTAGRGEYFVIGGAEIFRLMLPYADRIYLTVVHQSFEADTFFPKPDMADWQQTKSWEAEAGKDDGIAHTFYVFDRRPER